MSEHTIVKFKNGEYGVRSDTGGRSYHNFWFLLPDSSGWVREDHYIPPRFPDQKSAHAALEKYVSRLPDTGEPV